MRSTGAAADRLTRQRARPQPIGTHGARHVPMVRPCIGDEETRSVLEVLESGHIAQGPVVSRFERAFAAYCGVEHAVAVSSGTAALHAALLAAGVGEGDEVVTTPFSFVATANAVLMAGARPVFADIDPQTMNLCPERTDESLTSRTRAVLLVHLYGRACDMEPFYALTRHKGIRLIEDACQAHGASYRRRMSGSLGDAACFSFYATKNMTCGEGGMITTDDGYLAERARRLRHHGQDGSGRYIYRELGYNYRLTDLAAAIGLRQLEKLPALNARRLANAGLYRRLLSGVPGLLLPPESEETEHVYHQFTVRVIEGEFGLDRSGLAEALSRRGIETGVYYPLPLHVYPQFASLGYRWGDFPNAERASREVLSLPVGPHLDDEDIAHVAACIREVAENAAP